MGWQLNNSPDWSQHRAWLVLLLVLLMSTGPKVCAAAETAKQGDCPFRTL